MLKIEILYISLQQIVNNKRLILDFTNSQMFVIMKRRVRRMPIIINILL